MEHTGQPTVILAKTVKGYGLGEAGEGRNISHQQKKMNEKELREFRQRFDIPISDDVIADMPFLSFQISPEEALRNAGRLLQEGGAQAVKVEGGERTVPVAERLSAAGIPVVGHLGLTPQSVNETGGFRLQAKTAADAAQLLRDTRAMEAAGAFAVVLELIPAEVAKGVTEAIAREAFRLAASKLSVDTQFVARQVR
jgi:3-methyl-2-oxobutanoate hydroxymethyltransferase